jgi:hypothetical protein
MEQPDADYVSGDDVIVEFIGYRYAFSATDFAERVAAAAKRLELVPDRDLTPGETNDLVALTADGSVGRPRSPLGRYLVRNRTAIDGLHQETACYWLRKLVFRGAWLDHGVKTGLLDVTFDEAEGEFGYRMPTDERPMVDVAWVPSWASLRYGR